MTTPAGTCEEPVIKDIQDSIHNRIYKPHKRNFSMYDNQENVRPRWNHGDGDHSESDSLTSSRRSSFSHQHEKPFHLNDDNIQDSTAPFNYALKCEHTGCKTKFYLSGRHHCRKCGISICNTHSCKQVRTDIKTWSRLCISCNKIVFREMQQRLYQHDQGRYLRTRSDSLSSANTRSRATSISSSASIDNGHISSTDEYSTSWAVYPAASEQYTAQDFLHQGGHELGGLLSTEPTPRKNMANFHTSEFHPAECVPEIGCAMYDFMEKESNEDEVGNAFLTDDQDTCSCCSRHSIGSVERALPVALTATAVQGAEDDPLIYRDRAFETGNGIARYSDDVDERSYDRLEEAEPADTSATFSQVPIALTLKSSGTTQAGVRVDTLTSSSSSSSSYSSTGRIINSAAERDQLELENHRGGSDTINNAGASVHPVPSVMRAAVGAASRSSILLTSPAGPELDLDCNSTAAAADLERSFAVQQRYSTTNERGQARAVPCSPAPPLPGYTSRSLTNAQHQPQQQPQQEQQPQQHPQQQQLQQQNQHDTTYSSGILSSLYNATVGTTTGGTSTTTAVFAAAAAGSAFTAALCFLALRFSSNSSK